MQRLFKSGSSIYSLVLLFCALNLSYTFMNSLFWKPSIIYDISDFINDPEIRSNNIFKIYGVLKQNSIEYDTCSNCYRFEITNFKEDISVIFKGVASLELKEGDNVILTGYLPDENDKHLVVATEYNTNHSMEVENWENTLSKKRTDNSITL